MIGLRKSIIFLSLGIFLNGCSDSISTVAPHFLADNKLEDSLACFIDVLTLKKAEEKGGAGKVTLNIAGWGTDGSAKRPPVEVYVKIVEGGGKTFYGKSELRDRPDVAKAHNENAILRSGFLGSFDLPYSKSASVEILMNIEGSPVRCGNTKQVVLEE